MVEKERDKFEALLNLPKTFTLSNLDDYVNAYLECKLDRNRALHELDSLIALLQNHILSFSLYIKQHYLMKCVKTKPSVADDVPYLTKQEIANRYRVSTRTVTNWIIDGLKVEEIGGVKRISIQAIEQFKKEKRTKKFHWKIC